MRNSKIIIAGDKNKAEIPEDLCMAFQDLKYTSSFYHFYYSKFIHKIAWGAINTPFRFSKKIGYSVMHLINLDINHKFIKYVLNEKPNLIIIINGFSLMKDSILELKNNRIKVINWVVDDPSRAQFSYFIEASSVYDTIFCCSKNWLNYVKIYNKNIIYLPLAVNLKKYKKVKNINNFKYDLCFVGTFTENDPSSYFRFYLLDFLSKYDYKIRVAGKNALKYLKEKNKKFILSNEQSLSEVMKIYQDSKIIFNPFNTYNQEVVSLRIFETGGMGTFQIVPFQEELSELFGDKIISFKDLNELTEKVSFYINNIDERYKKAEELSCIILEKHTYESRAETIIQYLS